VDEWSFLREIFKHRQIFDLVQKVLDATFENRRDKMDTIMDFLVNYTVKHFENEECLMEESNVSGKQVAVIKLAN